MSFEKARIYTREAMALETRDGSATEESRGLRGRALFHRNLAIADLNNESLAAIGHSWPKRSLFVNRLFREAFLRASVCQTEESGTNHIGD